MAKRSADARKGDRPAAPSPYAGRWVARLEGKIVAHGGTPEAARLGAQSNRHKETPEVSFMSLNEPLPSSPIKDRVASLAGDQEVFLVGGAVRDGLLGRDSHDFDFAVRGNAIALARRVAGNLKADFYILDDSFDAARVISRSAGHPRNILDFASFRGPDLQADLYGRDFTINAIALDLKNQTVLDPLNGASDLRARTIRACAATAMQADPIRILRAVRLAAALDFKIDPETRRAMRVAVNLLPNVSAERQRDELFRILDGDRADTALRALEVLGVFPYLLPELADLKGVQQSLPHVYDVWEHTLSVVQNLDGILDALGPVPRSDRVNGMHASLLSVRLGRYRIQLAEHFSKELNPDRTMRALLFFAALYHDVSKPSSRSVDESARVHFFGHEHAGAAVAAARGHQLNLSNDEITRIQGLVDNHMRFSFLANRMEMEHEAPSRKAIYRFFRAAGEGGADLVLLGLADLRGTRGPRLTEEAWSRFVDVARILLENLWERPEETVFPPQLVSGRDVMREYNLAQGPAVGELLEAIREAQASGDVMTREEALDFGRGLMDKRRAGEKNATRKTEH
jgi:tRNA nucleotidyltransferase/poly(A) polymerase